MPEEARTARSSGVDHGRPSGELLALKWEHVSVAELVFWETKNGRARRLPVSPAMKAVFDQCPKTRSPWVFTNPRTHQAYTVNSVAHVFKRAVVRAGILTGDVTLHTLRHTAISRMVPDDLLSSPPPA